MIKIMENSSSAKHTGENVTHLGGDNLTAYPLSPQVYMVIGFILTFIGIVALIGNCLMIKLLLHSKFRQPVNFFILNCLVCNLIESGVGLPMTAFSNYAKRWLFGMIGCIFYGCLMYTMVLVNLVTLTFIGIYRYIAIFHREKGKSLKEKNNIAKFILGIWTYSLFWSTLPLFGWGSFGFERIGTSCTVSWEAKTSSERSYILCMFIFVLLVPVTTLMVVYTKIFHRIVLQLHAKIVPIQRIQNPSPSPAVEDEQQQRKWEIEALLTKIIAVNAALFCFSWVPYGSFSFLSSVGVHLSAELTALPLILAKTQCAFTPLVYFFAHKQYQQAVLEILRIKKQELA